MNSALKSRLSGVLILPLLMGMLTGFGGWSPVPPLRNNKAHQNMLLPVITETLEESKVDRGEQEPEQVNNFYFAVIGDYGQTGGPEGEVAALVKSWNPDLIITTGDNNYNNGSADTIDKNIGQYFREFIHPYNGDYPGGGQLNRFFPSLGNHDWNTVDAEGLPYPYLEYFSLPGNERYYDFTWGPAHFFIIDSDPHEPDGYEWNSLQAKWLKNKLAVSYSPWKIVIMHHSKYSSAVQHGSISWLQDWDFAEWGADFVLSGHDHTYERISREGILYFVNGLGGRSIYEFGEPVLGSQVRYNGDYGAMLVNVSISEILFQFINRQGDLIDEVQLVKPLEISYLPVLYAAVH